jgi:hypothetical protein
MSEQAWPDRSRRFYYVPSPRFGELTEVAGQRADLARANGRGDEASAVALRGAMICYAIDFTRRIILE